MKVEGWGSNDQRCDYLEHGEELLEWNIADPMPCDEADREDLGAAFCGHVYVRDAKQFLVGTPAFVRL